ncbi:MAG TPA: hypothetical protein PKJ33_03805 [Alphaproteobacteria bacterium]|nr:hypothetical protein [Alphaproteobacteria bacterium]
MKYKKLLYILLAVILLVWVGYRAYVINSESARQVFNPIRAELEHGAPVNKIEVEKKVGTLKEPIFVKNNRALVSGIRINKFKIGQVVEGGKIVSVSNQIDLDSGLFLVKTSGVPDGTHFVEVKYNGFFVPAYAVKDGFVMVSENGIAKQRKVTVIAQDSENAAISDGLLNGDVVILSQADDGEKVR